jgi:hypothetical protein
MSSSPRTAWASWSTRALFAFAILNGALGGLLYGLLMYVIDRDAGVADALEEGAVFAVLMAVVWIAVLFGSRRIARSRDARSNNHP